jgi:hypothetical protein
MLIRGGTYAEKVTLPPADGDLGGSGYRAALALQDKKARLLTAAEDSVSPTLVDAVSGGVVVARRSESVLFDYFTTWSRPNIFGADAGVESIPGESSDVALIFGMIEANAPMVASARCVILDPQSAQNPQIAPLVPADVEDLIVCLNRRELSHLASTNDVMTGAAALLSQTGASAIVTKAGAFGSLVTTAGRSEWIGVHPTMKVWSLGSGDVFSAGLASAIENGADVFEAAKVGSASAAWWCHTRHEKILPAILDGTPFEVEGMDPPLEQQRAPTIYLAAPFFTLAERYLVEAVREQLVSLGAEVFSPLHDVGRGGDEVATADLEGLDVCDGVLALLDGWDPGTLYETGWAHHKGLPIVGFCSTSSEEGDKMLVGSGAEVHRDLTTALYRSIWLASGAELHAGRYS